MSNCLQGQWVCKSAWPTGWDNGDEKKGPRDMVNVSWALCKFFILFSILFFVTGYIHTTTDDNNNMGAPPPSLLLQALAHRVDG